MCCLLTFQPEMFRAGKLKLLQRGEVIVDWFTVMFNMLIVDIYMYVNRRVLTDCCWQMDIDRCLLRNVRWHMHVNRMMGVDRMMYVNIIMFVDGWMLTDWHMLCILTGVITRPSTHPSISNSWMKKYRLNSESLMFTMVAKVHPSKDLFHIIPAFTRTYIYALW